ncbi:Crp/Fnr family transcriptional regulator [Polyangium aurulentum]|nr:Crp/Fnr family transcriptional regulator [Polyangium aurulentum]
MVTSMDVRRASVDAPRVRIQRALKLCGLFEKASRATCEEAAEVAQIEIIPGGGPLVQQGLPVTSLAVLGRGRARLERTTADGQLVPLGYRGSGDLLGEACLAGADKHEESAVAMEESEVVRVPIDAIRGYLANDTALGLAVVGVMLSRQRETEDRIESLLFRDVEGRLAEFLLRSAERWGVPSPKGTLISAPITHLEIAQAIGSTRETVTLTLGALRREGLLDVMGRRLIVADREALAKRR